MKNCFESFTYEGIKHLIKEDSPSKANSCTVRLLYLVLTLSQNIRDFELVHSKSLIFYDRGSIILTYGDHYTPCAHFNRNVVWRESHGFVLP